MNIILILLSIFFAVILLLRLIKKEWSNQLALISRIFVGIVFAYSGFVKAVDPLGFTYKLIDYFNAFEIPFFIPAALFLSMLASAIEFSIGFSLITGAFPKINTWLATLFMIIFTPLTFVLALNNPVTDCGCFGDALIITNWQTFWKNIIIDVPVIILLMQKGTFKYALQKKNAFISSLIGLVIVLGVSIYSFRHLPIIDFRPFKIGENITDGMTIPEGAKQDVYKSSFTYKNLKTEVLKDFTEDELEEPTEHPDLWEFVDSKSELIEAGYRPAIHDFSISNSTLGDITNEVLSDTSFTLIIMSYDLTKCNFEALAKFETLSQELKNKSIKTFCLTAAIEGDIKKVKDSLIRYFSYDTIAQHTFEVQKNYFYEHEGNVEEFLENELPEEIDDSYTLMGVEEVKTELFSEPKLSFDFFICDPTTLKTIVRANPGLVLLKKGTVINKWHYNDFPNLKDFE